jgi:hypothetical protein
MTDYLVTCVNRAGSDPEHCHIIEVGIRPRTGGSGRIVPVKLVRQQIKRGVHRFFSVDGSGHRVRVRRFKCTCGRKTIRTLQSDLTDGNLSLKHPCA